MSEVCKNTVDAICGDEDLMAFLIVLKEKNGGELKIMHLFKFGSDGSGGGPIFKQVLDEERQQGSVYATGMVTMQLVAELPDEQVAIIYNNNLVNSSLSWRPLRLLFKKETTEIIKEEQERLEKERDELEDYEVMDGITITHVGYYCMCDMKVHYLKILLPISRHILATKRIIPLKNDFSQF